ncbi:hypothetical protein [Dokdonella sp.]|uniref:hypothetical protein n=1 Tax=Dokdonella sp. TaxID=2291710 RepID=UPI003C4A45D9
MVPTNPRAPFFRHAPLLAFALLAAASLPTQAGEPAISMDVINSGMTSWLIDGQANPPLTLLRGKTYEFVMQNVSGAHPLNINTTNTTGSANLYNDGVTNNGASGTQTLTFVVPLGAPDNLHYNCGNHSAMNGPISILTDELFAANFDPVVLAIP